MATDTPTLGDLYDYANNMVAQRMMMLEGVSNAQVYGSARAVCIQMDANAFASRGLTVLDVANAVTTEMSYSWGRFTENSCRHCQSGVSFFGRRATTISSSDTRTARPCG